MVKLVTTLVNFCSTPMRTHKVASSRHRYTDPLAELLLGIALYFQAFSSVVDFSCDR